MLAYMILSLACFFALFFAVLALLRRAEIRGLRAALLRATPASSHPASQEEIPATPLPAPSLPEPAAAGASLAAGAPLAAGSPLAAAASLAAGAPLAAGASLAAELPFDPVHTASAPSELDPPPTPGLPTLSATADTLPQDDLPPVLSHFPDEILTSPGNPQLPAKRPEWRFLVSTGRPLHPALARSLVNPEPLEAPPATPAADPPQPPAPTRTFSPETRADWTFYNKDLGNLADPYESNPSPKPRSA